MICPFLHISDSPDFRQNANKLCITENLIDCKLQNVYFNVVSNIVTWHKASKEYYRPHALEN